uniref:Chromodomain-helicase-DNA-binding protein 1 n=1 Tax=Setaria digitata TaxID=48799 RepID=A0A915PHJ3_9BILA
MMSSSSVSSDSEFTEESSRSRSMSDRQEATVDDLIEEQESPTKDDVSAEKKKFEEDNDGELSSIASPKSDSESKDGESDASGSKNSENGDLSVNERKSDSIFSAESGEGETSMSKKKRGIKITDETRKFLEDENILRRSSRQRKEAMSSNVGIEKSVKKSGKRKFLQSEDDETSDGNSSLEVISSRKMCQKPKKQESKKRPRKHGISSDDDSCGIRSTRRSKVDGEKSRINYRDISSDEEINSDDVLEWDEGDKVEGSGVTDHNTSTSETIEKVLRHRAGYPGATGASTTCYNVEDKGDPNVKLAENGSEIELERQYLIKWLGWSHLHNTWESENSLKLCNAKGLKKIDNYMKRLRDIEEWKLTADKEYIEFFDCEQQMNDELNEQYKVIERVIAHQISRSQGETEGTEYFVKWCGLPYSECTWEEEHLIARQFQDKIDSYCDRRDNGKIPNKYCPVLKKRPKFEKLNNIPHFLQRKDEPEHELRDYQLEGVNWMLHAWTKENSCILADEMGLGKTIQSISFLSVLYHKYQLYGTFLVVVPLSTMASWQREFETWAPALNVVTYVGDVTSRDLIRQFEMFVQSTKRLKVNVVLTTYEILLKDKSFLGSFEWAVLAVDEAHRLKNDESLLYRSLFEFTTNHRLLVTGTPLQNSLKELWALLHFIMPEKFDSWTNFEAEHHDSDHKTIASLHRKLQPFLLRRVKKDVEKSLPAKVVEQILRVDMTAQQKQYYKWILTKNYKELSKGVKGSINGFVNLVMELKKCCNHASLVRSYDHAEESVDARLQQLLKSSGKLILLDKLLCRLQETGHRVLIFSQMVMMLDIMQEYLQLRRFPSQRLDGSMRSDLRKAALDHFNAPNSPDFCFLLSTRAGGLGINLATADTVIIFDSDWNPQNDLQAMSRAHRIGQKKQVNIYRLVTKASVEEEIVERAKRKLVLDHLIIQRMDTTGRTVLSKATVTNGTMPFDKQDLAMILKFGAEELFKEKEGEEQEPEVDIDNILQGAETRECDQQNSGSELLNAFRYADFSFDENKDVPTLNVTTIQTEADQKNLGDSKSWDEIIPEADRKRFADEERERAEKELFLGPRQRTKIPEVAAEAGDSDEDERKKRKRKRGRDSPLSEEEGSDEDKPKRARKKMLFNFTESEVRKFIRSFRKFAEPLTRLEAIAQDAELEEFSKNELEQLGNELLAGCQKAQSEYEEKLKESMKKPAEDGKKRQDRGAIFKFGNIDVYVRPLLKMQSDLIPLHDLVKSAGDIRLLQIPGYPKEQKGWDVEWEIADDLALLKGIYRYGLGSWEEIKMDPSYGLAEKIWLKDKSKKPQSKHIQARAEYLLKYLARNTRPSENTSARGKSLKKIHYSALSAAGVMDKIKEKKGPKEEKKEKKCKGEHGEEKIGSEKKEPKLKKERIAINLDHLTINKSKYKKDVENKKSSQFAECVKIMRPAQKYMRKLVQCDDLSSTDSLRYLLKIGDHINGHLGKISLNKSQLVEKWHSYLWIFLSCFTRQEPGDLLQRYRIAARDRANNNETEAHRKHHHRHHHHHHDAKKSQRDDISTGANEMSVDVCPTVTERKGDSMPTASGGDRRTDKNSKYIRLNSDGYPTMRHHSNKLELHKLQHSTKLATVTSGKDENQRSAALLNEDFDTYKPSVSQSQQPCSMYSNQSENGSYKDSYRYRGDYSSSSSGNFHRTQYGHPTYRDRARGGRHEHYPYREHRREHVYYRDKSDRSYWERNYTETYRDHGDRDYRQEFRHVSGPSNSTAGSSSTLWSGPAPPVSFPSQSAAPLLNGPVPSFTSFCPPAGLLEVKALSTVISEPRALHTSFMRPPPIPPHLDHLGTGNPVPGKTESTVDPRR